MAIKPIKYSKGYNYQLKRDALIMTCVAGYNVSCDLASLSNGGLLLIKKEFAWDGPSGPTVDTKSFMRGALAHDALYMLMRLELIPRHERIQADRTLYKLCRQDGMWWYLAKSVYLAVRLFAGSAAHPDHRKKEYTAP